MTRERRRLYCTWTKYEGTWWVRGPLEVLRSGAPVEVKARNNTRTMVRIDPDSIIELPKDACTQWDDGSPGIARILETLK